MHAAGLTIRPTRVRLPMSQADRYQLVTNSMSACLSLSAKL